MTVILGDCVEAMAAMAAGSVDAVVTDPPYGLEFMGKDWDRLAGTPGYNERGRITDRPESQVPYGRGGGVNSYQAGRPMQAWHEAWAREALRVLKPGGHLLAFGGTRTYHRLACAVEDAGFEIRDCLAWLYGSGFPKSLNLDGDWQGWGTALKPAFEPVVVSRKPLAGTVAGNVQAHGTGALNIDATRIGSAEVWPGDAESSTSRNGYGPGDADGWEGNWTKRSGSHQAGRWPANVVLDPEAAAMLDAQSGESQSRIGDPRGAASGVGWGMSATGSEYEDRGGASRFFYCAKAGSRERNAGLDGFEKVDRSAVIGQLHEGTSAAGNTTGRYLPRQNVHPTVKPIELMRWLVRLVTPPSGTVLDPFTGSGTTGIAATLERFTFTGIERDPDYHRIAQARIEWWARHAGEGDTAQILEAAEHRDEHAAAGQLDLLGDAA